jgi:hypothetical protein
LIHYRRDDTSFNASRLIPNLFLLARPLPFPISLRVSTSWQFLSWSESSGARRIRVRQLNFLGMIDDKQEKYEKVELLSLRSALSAISRSLHLGSKAIWAEIHTLARGSPMSVLSWQGDEVQRAIYPLDSGRHS